MESKITVRKNMTLTNEKAKNMCRLNYEDNNFYLQQKMEDVLL